VLVETADRGRSGLDPKALPMSPHFACTLHPDEAAVAACRSCDRRMCEGCWRRTVDGDPWCKACVTLLDRPISAVVPILGFALTLGLLVLTIRVFKVDPVVRWSSVAAGSLCSLWGARRLAKRANHHRANHRVAVRAPDLDARAPRRHPYRGALLGLARRITPPVSGVMAVTNTVGAFALIAAIAPAALDLPRWIELEVVLLGWWLAWIFALTLLLFRGWRIARDFPPSLGVAAHQSGGPGERASRWLDVPDPSGCLDLEGLVWILAVVAGVLLAGVIFEFVVPALFLGVYGLMTAALRRVANDHHDCEGRFVPSLLFGALWATVYTLPLAGLTWLVGMVVSR
jgi:hypothetical protein